VSDYQLLKKVSVPWRELVNYNSKLNPRCCYGLPVPCCNVLLRHVATYGYGTGNATDGPCTGMVVYVTS